MYERKITRMHVFLDERAAECKAQDNVLTEEGRFDEAVFEKVEGNVFEIFKTVLDAGVKICGNDWDKLEMFFRGKLDQIPENWRVSLQKAESNGDLAKAHLERIKLDVSEEIRSKLDEIWGE